MTQLEKNEQVKSLRTKVECWSRVCGYLRPTMNWNDGKQAEFKDRKVFKSGRTR